MKLLKLFLIIGLYFNFVQLNSSENNEVLQIKISKNIRCLVCQGQSVYDSQSDFAESVKLVIKQKLDEGKSEAEIYKFLKIQYGEWILYDPDFNKNTFFLWLLPIIVFIGGGWLILKKINFFKL